MDVSPVKELAHRAIDELPEQVSWDELLKRLRQLAIPRPNPAQPHRSTRSFLAEELAFMEREIWSKIPAELRGKPVTKEEREEILGYGPDGV